MKNLYLFLLTVLFFNFSYGQVKINSSNFSNLGDAVNAINNGSFTGAIMVQITGNTSETAIVSINASGTGGANYSSIKISPSGGAARTILFSGGNSILYFNSCSNVTIDGLNANGNSLKIAHSQLNAAVIQIQNGASNNTITNCTVLSSGVNGVIRLLNDNVFNTHANTIMNCNIGPYDSNLPNAGIKMDTTYGSITDTLLHNNNIYDFSSGSIESYGVYIGNNVPSFTIQYNRFYQTAARSVLNNYAIYVSNPSSQAAAAKYILNNEIGSANSSGTGTYSILGGKFTGINFNMRDEQYECYINDNNIKNIAVSGGNSGEGLNAPLYGIIVRNGKVKIQNNTVGSMTTSGSISYTSSSSSASQIFGIYKASNGDSEILNNNIGGISASSSVNAKVGIQGIHIENYSTTSTPLTSCSGNIVGGTNANSIVSTSSADQASVFGIQTSIIRGSIKNNTVRNITGYGFGSDNSTPVGVVGIDMREVQGGVDDNSVSNNTVYNLTNGNTTGATYVGGIFHYSYDGNTVQSNNVYSLTSASNNSSALMEGITCSGTATNLYNNMVDLGNSTTNGITIYGIRTHFLNVYSDYNIRNNSVYIGGSPNSGSGNTSAFYQDYSLYSYHIHNNIFYNQRSNSGSTGSHSSIRIVSGGNNPYFRANVYYGTGTGYVLGFQSNTPKTTLADWNSWSHPFDDFGYFTDPQFIAPTATPSNLHINPSVLTIVEGHGYDAITNDIDNEIRSGLTPNDIGADAGNFIGIPVPVITSLSAASACTQSTFVVNGTGLSEVMSARIGNTPVGISGRTTTTVTITTGNVALSGNVYLTNDAGTAMSAAVFNVYANPAITVQPTAKIVCTTASTTFSVTATGATTYQWRRNGVNLTNTAPFSNVNSATLTISNPGIAYSGSTFDVVLASPNASCTTTSAAAILTVSPLPTPVVQAGGNTTVCSGGSVLLYTGYNGPAVQFDGNDDYMSIPRHIADDFTIEYWVKTTQNGNTGTQWYSGNGIVDAEVAGLTDDFGTSLLNSKLAFGIGGGQGDYTISSTTSINTGSWFHVAVTRVKATGQVKIYINGILEASGVSTNLGSVTTPIIRVGGIQAGGNFFNGSVDDLRMWNVALTAQQIKSGMNNGFPANTYGLVDNLPMDENTGATVADLASGSASTLVNGPTWANRSTTATYSSYLWSNGATTPSISPTTGGSYYVTVTDANSCSGVSSGKTITIQAPTIAISPAAPSICMGGSTTLTAGGAATYTWSPPTGLSAVAGNTVTANPSATTTYTVTGTDSDGCLNITTVTVTVNAIPVSQLPGVSICPGGSTVLTGTGAVSYVWSPATGLSATTGTSVTASPASNTTYTITATDAGGCITKKTILVTVNPPSAPVIESFSICPGSSIVLTGNPSATYVWSPATGLSATTGASVTATPSVSTTYTVIGTEANGCSNTKIITVTLNPQAAVLESVSICSGSSTVLTGNPSASYSWSPATGLSDVTGATVTANPSVTTTYTVTGTQEGGCINTKIITVTVKALPVPNVTVFTPTAFCAGGAVALTAYDNAAPAQPALAFNNTIFACNRHIDADFTIEFWLKTTQSGNASGNWYNGAGIIDMEYPGNVNDFGISMMGGKIAFGIGLADSGADKTIISHASVNTGQWVHVAVTRNISSGDFAIYINGLLDIQTTGTNHNLLNVAPNIYIGRNRNNASNYFIGSLDEIRFWNTVRTPAEIAGNATATFTAGTPNLADYYQLNEGSGPYVNNLINPIGQIITNPFWTTRVRPADNILWSNGATTPMIIVSDSGTYSATITNADGCTNTTGTTTVNILPLPVITISGTNAICTGTGTTLTADGGLSYSWSPATGLSATTGTTVTANPLNTTTYTVVGSNANGCQSTASVTVTVNPIPQISVSSSAAIVGVGSSSTLSVSGTDTYSWSPSTGLNATTGDTVIATPTVTTTYTVTGTSLTGCTTTQQITVKVIPPTSATDNALDFDGTDDYVSIPVQNSTLSTLYASFTFEAWVKPTDATKRMHIMSTRNGGDATFDLQIQDGNRLHIDIGNGSGWVNTNINVTVPYTANTWMHVACIIGYWQYVIYINGNQVASGGIGNEVKIYTPNHFITIGNSSNESTFFKGVIDDVRMYNTILSQAQIQADMNRNFYTSNRIAFYSFNQGTPGGNNVGLTTLPEQNIPENLHGTLHNFALNGQTSNWVAGHALTPQSVTFDAITAATYGDSDFTLPATASSGLPVSYSSSNPAVAVITGNTVTITGAGTTNITALQDGNLSYSPAPVVIQPLTVYQKTLTLSGIDADKIYDGTNTAMINAVLTGIVGTDDVTFSGAGQFASSSVGSAIAVTSTGILTGLTAGNYNFEQPQGLAADITPKPLTVLNAVADDKAYDGNMNATISGAQLSGVIAPDEVFIASSGGIFDTPNAGNDIPVTANLILGGQDSGNYTVIQPSGLTANIAASSITAVISGTSTICVGATANIRFFITGGTDPCVLTYTDGTSNFMVDSYFSGSLISVSPSVTTTYTLVSIANAAVQSTGEAVVTVNMKQTYYVDVDNDGYGDAANIVLSCLGQPANTVSNNTDCAPTDPLKWRTGTFYVDADNDGFYNGNDTPTEACYGASTPSGFTTAIIGADCNDNNAEVNANHVEVLGNGIDDNCSGVTDEDVAGTASYVNTNQCGVTLSNIANTIYAYQVVGATGYRFEVTNGATVRTYDSTTNSFNLFNLSGPVPAYGTTYSIRVAAKTGGFWRAYSTVCTVTTPSLPATTTLTTTQCGSTIASMSTSIYCNQVTAASMYRFEVSGGSQATRTYDSSLNRFAMTNLSPASNYATTYQVRVAMLIGGVWQDYGAPCSITTPATPPTTSVIASQCGITISNSWTSIYCNPVTEATGYRFEVKNGAQTRFADVATSRFSLWNLAGGPAAGTVYSIRVAILYNGVYQAFGPTCTVTTAAVITRQSETAVSAFAVKASPNPFADTFRLDINTSSEDRVEVKVYDMIGKLVEAHQSSVAEMGTLEVGSRFPSGVYNIVVTQGENVKTLRVIKR